PSSKSAHPISAAGSTKDAPHMTDDPNGAASTASTGTPPALPQPSPPPAAAEIPSLEELTAELHRRRTRHLAMGGEEQIAKQHGRNKLTARERLALLFDEGSFREF